MARKADGEVLRGVRADLAELPVRPGTAGLRATAVVLARVLDSDSPAREKVAASKTLTEVLVRLAGGQAGGGVDVVGRIRERGPRRRAPAA